MFVNFVPNCGKFDYDIKKSTQGGTMLKKLWYRLCLAVVMVLSLSGCSAIRGIGDGLINSFKGFQIHFP